MKDRSIPFLLAAYVGVLGSVALGATYAYSTVTFEGGERTQRPQREKSILEERIASSQEIKRALAKPMPQAEPLPPITAKLERAPAKVATEAPRPQHRKLSKEARDAFASGNPDFTGSVSSQPMALRDRHAVVTQ
jgi:hypothetical protein